MLRTMRGVINNTNLGLIAIIGLVPEQSLSHNGISLAGD
jgi:hypothetical protein